MFNFYACVLFVCFFSLCDINILKNFPWRCGVFMKHSIQSITLINMWFFHLNSFLKVWVWHDNTRININNNNNNVDNTFVVQSEPKPASGLVQLWLEPVAAPRYRNKHGFLVVDGDVNLTVICRTLCTELVGLMLGRTGGAKHYGVFLKVWSELSTHILYLSVNSITQNWFQLQPKILLNSIWTEHQSEDNLRWKYSILLQIFDEWFNVKMQTCICFLMPLSQMPF